MRLSFIHASGGTPYAAGRDESERPATCKALIMEMGTARSRIGVLLLLALSAGGFGYCLGWQRAQSATKADSDRQFMIFQDVVREHQAANASQEGSVPLTGLDMRTSS